MVLGREGDLRLEDPRASRAHCRLEPERGAYRVEDLGSRNGTWLAGVRVVKDWLPPNVVLRVGDTLLVLDPSMPAPGFADPVDVHPAGAVELVGTSTATRALRAEVELAATVDGPVLLLGPTGTGKEVAARALHRLSGRRGPFVPVNCGSIPAELAESELFGHARGAFTGATAAKAGLFAEAEGGTLFLDELGELPHAQQVKLLRVLEDGVVRGVGESQGRVVRTRVVCATNADVTARLRADLRARLSEWTLRLPPLVERLVDVVPLARHLAIRAGADAAWPMSAEFLEALLLCTWPANVRELDKVLRRALPLARMAAAWDLQVLPADLQRPVLTRGDGADGAPDRAQLEAALAAAGGVVARVAEHYGRDRTQVYRWIRRLGLNPDAYR